jgi:hypothetical protein
MLSLPFCTICFKKLTGELVVKQWSSCQKEVYRCCYHVLVGSWEQGQIPIQCNQSEKPFLWCHSCLRTLELWQDCGASACPMAMAAWAPGKKNLEESAPVVKGRHLRWFRIRNLGRYSRSTKSLSPYKSQGISFFTWSLYCSDPGSWRVAQVSVLANQLFLLLPDPKDEWG